MLTRLDKMKWLTKENLIVVILTGVLLLVICFPVEEKESSILDMDKDNIKEEQNAEINTNHNNETVQGVYRAQLEQQVRDILTSMDGVGRVEVLITLQSSEELVVEKDTRITRDSSEENNGENTSTSQSVDSEEITVFSQTGSSVNEPYVIKKIQPKVEGVLVIAEGAGRGEVNKNITEAIQVLFGIESHKIKVAKMKSN